MVGHTTDEKGRPTSDRESGIVGVSTYKVDGNAVEDVRVIERDGEVGRARWLGEDNRVDGIGTPETWESIGVCVTEWDDDQPPSEYEPTAAVEVHTDTDGVEWTTNPVDPFEVDE